MHANYLKWEALMRGRTDSSSPEFLLAHQNQASVTAGQDTQGQGKAAFFAPGVWRPGLWPLSHPPSPAVFILVYEDEDSPIPQISLEVVPHTMKLITINAKSGELMLVRVEPIFPVLGPLKDPLPHKGESVLTKQDGQISTCRASKEQTVVLSLVSAERGKIKTNFSE